MSSTPDPTGRRAGEQTQGDDYAHRLVTLEQARWKQMLDVQRPYRWNLRRLDLGRTLDVGCGIGRNLLGLPAGSLGVDHNAHSVQVARQRGLQAMTTEEFLASEHSAPASFDALLLAHVLEHVDQEVADELLAQYLPSLRPGGALLLICPQELGYRTDATHVRFVDAAAMAAHAERAGLRVERSYSFPLPRLAGRVFPYNEFVVLARRSS